MENLRLIVGLGNPGREYARNRHNAGFMVLDQLAERWKARWGLEKKFAARLARVERDGHRLILCQPRTFMNASGEAIRSLVAFYQAPLEAILVVVDDADLPLGEIRLRARGSSGGHHGLESIEQHLATREFARLRIGIGRERSDVRQITGHVLSDFSRPERELMEKVLARACDQIECWLREGILQAMSRYNGVVAA
ncbi:MAG: aminoacyl-tRNA hydrolase [Verrucomicrobia subdivision 3 bacterium]|nr:aminoacyl-tRNA hydrolase [Limisphaerales bacterium]